MESLTTLVEWVQRNLALGSLAALCLQGTTDPQSVNPRPCVIDMLKTGLT